jgi:phage baseplate assembly protein W
MAESILIRNSKLYPNDVVKDYGTLAIKLPMNNTLAKSIDSLFNMSYTTEDQAISNFINLLFTKPGERVMQPNFGVGIQFYLFEQNTEMLHSKITNSIEYQVDIWLPYIIIKNLEVKQYYGDDAMESENSIGISIMFSVTETGANKLVEFSTSGYEISNV